MMNQMMMNQMMNLMMMNQMIMTNDNEPDQEHVMMIAHLPLMIPILEKFRNLKHKKDQFYDENVKFWKEPIQNFILK